MTQKSSLLAARNPDGGWPYYAGKTSRLESTAWALLALHASGEKVSAEPLLTWPRQNGWLLDRSSGVVNVGFNALAALSAQSLGANPADLDPLVRLLVASKGQKLPQSPTNRQDNSLQGWAWTDGTFSWVEPTAWAMIALKRLGRRRDAPAANRLAEAERLLTDRVCAQGGWNFGNADVLGTKLDPYVPVTALGLLAMGDRRELDAVRRSVQYLLAHALSERSAMALGLSQIALSVYGAAPAALPIAISEQWRRDAFLGNLHVTALALYAEAAASEGYGAFRV